MRRVFLHLHCFGLNNTLISSLAWHNAFASAVVVKHPNLYKLVQALKKEELLLVGGLSSWGLHFRVELPYSQDMLLGPKQAI